jgi:nitroreductase
MPRHCAAGSHCLQYAELAFRGGDRSRQTRGPGQDLPQGVGSLLDDAQCSPNLHFANPAHEAMHTRIMATVPPFIEHFHDIPVYVIPCLSGRSDGQPAVIQSALWGTIAPAAWSFMLAARARGLGTVWTCLHLFFEEEAAQVLGIPYAEVMQACLIPVAYTQGTRFKPEWREPLDTMLHWET